VEWNKDNLNDDLAEAITQKTFDDEDEELEYIKEKLTEAGVYFHPNTGIVKLRKLYKQI
jgi:pentose-5-phosphate-3-epimerase